MSEDTVKTVLIRRIEGIKKKDAQSIADLVDKDRYTKFDDWPPFERQGLDALNREAEALKVLKEYDYEISEWKVDVINNVAIASFIINYRGTIRDLNFNIKSRVTAVLAKSDGEWKLIHEHWSRFPQKLQDIPQRPRRRFPFP
ncbi:MAG: YybH family protein [Candidatus Bathyarchaeales archaeon]